MSCLNITNKNRNKRHHCFIILGNEVFLTKNNNLTEFSKRSDWSPYSSFLRLDFMIKNISLHFLIQFFPNEPSIRPMQENPREFWILDSLPWSPDSRNLTLVFVSGTIRFCMLIISGIPDSLSCILDSKAQDSEFCQQNFPRFQIP